MAEVEEVSICIKSISRRFFCTIILWRHSEWYSVPLCMISVMAQYVNEWTGCFAGLWQRFRKLNQKKIIRRQSLCVFSYRRRRRSGLQIRTPPDGRRANAGVNKWAACRPTDRLTDGELFVVGERAPMFKWRVKSKPGRLPTPSKLSGLVLFVPPARTAAIDAPRSPPAQRRPPTLTRCPSSGR